MLNFVAFIICTCAAVIQYDNSWPLFTLNAIFALLNLGFAVKWIVDEIKKS